MSDLHDLFTLGDETSGPTETSKLFQDAQVTYENHGTDDGGTHDAQDESKDVREVAGVASMEQFQEAEPGTATPNAENNGDNNGSETRIMEGIFSRAGVHSALEHDHIVNGKRVVRADPKIIEAEAKRVAAEAAEELRRASEAARSVPIGTPLSLIHI